MKTKFEQTNNLKFLLIILLAVLLGACSKVEDSTQIDSKNYESAEKYIEEVAFEGSILLRKGGTDVIRQGFGLADKENQIANEVGTYYRIGSMSKAFTALGIMYLKREGLITSLDQTVSDFVDDFPFGDQITLRHLLTHRSGLPDHVGTFETMIREQNVHLTHEEISEIYAEALAEQGLDFTPGEKFSYSNTNYLLLALLAEGLSGVEYHQLLNNIAFTEIGMEHTYKSGDDFGGNGEAKGYFNGQPVDLYPMEVAFGAGDWASNIDDMEKWGDAWMENLLTPEEQAEVFPAPTQNEVTSIGMGWFTIRISGNLVYFHGGDIDGFTSIIALLPETNSIFIALSNKEGQRNTLDLMMETFVINEL